MKFIELPTKLKQSISPLYILKGDDSFIISSAIKHISNACGNEMPDFNKTVFDSENFSASKVIEAIEMMPIGDDKKFVLIKNISKINEADKKILFPALENIPISTCVVIVYTEPFKALKCGEIVDCGKMDFSMLSKYILSELKKSEKSMSSQTITTFIELCSYNMTKISNELKKLTNCSDDEEITTEDIHALVSADEEFQIFELTEALGRKNTDKVLTILSNFLEKKEPIQNLFGLISNHFRRVAHSAISDLSPSELADMFNVKEYAMVKAREQSKFFSKIELKNILQTLEDVDFMIKNGKMSAENAIFYLVFKILY